MSGRKSEQMLDNVTVAMERRLHGYIPTRDELAMLQAQAQAAQAHALIELYDLLDKRLPRGRIRP